MAHKIQVVVHKYKLGEEPKSYEYWLTKTVAERIAALEELRQQHIQLLYNGINPKFKKVYRKIKVSDLNKRSS